MALIPNRRIVDAPARELQRRGAGPHEPTAFPGPHDLPPGPRRAVRGADLPLPSALRARSCFPTAAIFARGRALLASFERGHRDEAFNNLVLPQSELAITALGHALAYDAARAAGGAERSET